MNGSLLEKSKPLPDSCYEPLAREAKMSKSQLSKAPAVSYREIQLDILTKLAEHIVHIDGVVGSSPTVTTTNPVGVQVQRLPDFFAYPSRVRTFRSQEYALFCQRGTQKGYAVHLKTAYPWKHFVHIHRDALANFRFFHQKHKQLTSSFSFEFRMPNRKKFQKIINTHLVAVL